MADKKDGLKIINEIIASGRAPESLLILCPSVIRRERAFGHLLNNFKLNKAEIKKIPLKTTDSRELKSLGFQSTEMSLFASERIFLFTETEETNAEKTDILLKLLKSPKAAKFYFLGNKLDKNSRLFKYFDEHKTLINLEDWGVNDVIRRLEKEAKDLGIQIQEDALKALCGLAASEDSDNPSFDLALKYMQQAALYCDDKPVTVPSLLELFPADLSEGRFAFIDRILEKKLLPAELSLQSMISLGENHFGLLTLLHRSITNALLIKLALQNGYSDDQIAKHLKAPFFILNKYKAVARGNSTEKLKKMLAEIVRADSMFKNRSLGDENVFSSLIFRLST